MCESRQRKREITWKADGEALIQRLPKVRGRYSPNVDLSKSTWFRVGGPAEVVFKPADAKDLAFFMKARSVDIPLHVIGIGSNLLIRDGGIPGVVIRLGRGFTTIAVGEDLSITAGAAVLDRNIGRAAQEEGIGGLEFLCGIPGAVGGAIRMNAGCYGREIRDVLHSALVVTAQGDLQQLPGDQLDFAYRKSGLKAHDIVVAGRFKGVAASPQEIQAKIEGLLRQRQETQPIRERTGGSTFANPEGHSAWKLIDQAGCRGYRRGGAQMSELHCNFMVNTGSATAEDLESLGEEVRRRVLETSGITLRWEIQRLGVCPGVTVEEAMAA